MTEDEFQAIQAEYFELADKQAKLPDVTGNFAINAQQFKQEWYEQTRKDIGRDGHIELYNRYAPLMRSNIKRFGVSVPGISVGMNANTETLVLAGLAVGLGLYILTPRK